MLHHRHRPPEAEDEAMDQVRGSKSWQLLMRQEIQGSGLDARREPAGRTQETPWESYVFGVAMHVLPSSRRLVRVKGGSVVVPVVSRRVRLEQCAVVETDGGVVV
ncbi:hypothetical protein Droror1_Dr00002359 [Drosera rotundifolia]